MITHNVMTVALVATAEHYTNVGTIKDENYLSRMIRYTSFEIMISVSLTAHVWFTSRIAP